MRLFHFFLCFVSFHGNVWGQSPLVGKQSSDSKIVGFEKSIQLDSNFPYYQNRSKESVVEEIYLAGYDIVRLIVLNESHVDSALLYQLKEKGIQVWLQASGCVTYNTTGYPADWHLWKMELNREVNGSHGYVFLSPFNQAFVQWKKEKLAALMEKYPFDGIEITEPYFPEWDAISRGTYGDIGPNARRAFNERFGEDVPNFNDSSAANYYKKVPRVYQQWIALRADAINHFLHEVINGAGGIREVRPDALVATWSIGVDAGPETAVKIQEYFGLNPVEMVRLVQPDAHIIQTHWMDWASPELPPDYVETYYLLKDKIRKEFPNLSVGLQTDIGSLKSMIRSREWIDELEESVRQNDYQILTMYEYHLGGYIYYEKPILKKVRRVGPDTVVLSFSKRMDAQKAENHNCYQFRKQDKRIPVTIRSVEIDGNRVILKSADFPEDSFDIILNHLSDTPNLWFFKGYAPLSIPINSVAKVN